MTVNYTTLLSLGQPVTGTESGAWGDDVNNAVTSYLDIAIAGTLSLTSASFTANALTLANTQGTSSATNIATTTAQYMVLKVSSLAANVTITAPSSSKLYLVDNADATYTVTIKAVGQSGYTVAKGTKAWVYFNGTDYVLASTNDINKLVSPLTVANGGTGLTSGTSGGVPYFSGTTAITSSGVLAANAVVLGGGAGAAPATTTTGTGVVSAINTNVNTTGGFVTQSGVLAANALLVGGGSGSPVVSTTTGNGVVTAIGNNINTTGGVVTQSGTLAASAVLVGGGSGTAISSTTTGTGVVTAIGTNINTSGGFVTQSGTLAANALMIGGGSGTAVSTTTTGTGVVTALGVNTGSAGAFVVNGGALGTPSSGTVTNLTGTASININGTVGATTPNTGAFTSITSTSASGISTIQAATQDGVKLLGRAGGTSSYTVTLTPTTLSSSTTLTLPNVTSTVAVLGTAQTFTSAQTFRAANSVRAEAAATQDAVVLAGRAGGTSSYAVTVTPAALSASRTLTLPDATTTLVGTDTTQTLTNKRVTPRVSTTTSSATPTINTDNVDMYGLTAQAVDITSFSTNLSGTPTDGQKLWIYIVGTAARVITWGASFESSTVTLPSTTVSTNRLDVGFVWNAATSKWRCVATA